VLCHHCLVLCHHCQVLRVVCRCDFNHTLAQELIATIRTALAWLQVHHIYTDEQLKEIKANRAAKAREGHHWPSMERLTSLSLRGKC
jgi:hypothetical protein